MNAPARILNLLHAARREDVAPVLALLSDAELAAGLASEHCDPQLRSVAADRGALCRALLDPRETPEDLPSKAGGVQSMVRLAARAPYQTVLPGGITPYGRPQADLRQRLAAGLNAALGTDAWRWYGAMCLVDGWSGSFGALLDEVAGWSTESQLPKSSMRFRLKGQVFLPGVLLAMAPPAVIAAALPYTAERSEGMIQGLLIHAPYHPAYQDYAFGPDGSDYARRSLCQSVGTPLAVAHELLDRELFHQDVEAIAYSHDDLALRLRIYRDPDSDTPWKTSRLDHTTPEEFHELLSATETAEEIFDLLSILRRVMERTPAIGKLRIFAYSRLAQLAGPEPVWTLEVAAAGGVDLLVHPAVRASMAVGDIAPIVAAAEAAAENVPGPPPPPPNQDSLTDWPLEDAVRDGLDGRPERWRTMLESSDKATESPLALVQWATGQSVRPAARDREDLTQSTNRPESRPENQSEYQPENQPEYQPEYQPESQPPPPAPTPVQEDAA